MRCKSNRSVAVFIGSRISLFINWYNGRLFPNEWELTFSPALLEKET